MKHRHIFVPPFWKYNRFCLLCGRLESLIVGKNTVQLTDNKISFGADATLDTAKQLGFNASSRLIYHDGTSVKAVVKYDFETGGDIRKITSMQTNPVVLHNSSVLTTIFEILFTPDFNTYPNGYWVFITPISVGYLFKVTNNYDGAGGGVTSELTLRHYFTTVDNGPISFTFDTGSIHYASITYYMIRLVKVGSVYYLSYHCSGRHTSRADYYGVFNSGTFGYVNGFFSVNSTNTPDRIKLTAQWNIADPELYVDFSDWLVILYGLR